MQARPAPASWVESIEKFIRWHRAADYPETTLQLRRYQITRFARDVELSPREITEDVILDYLTAQEWTPSTRRSFRTALRSFFQFAHSVGLTDGDPAAGLPRVRHTMTTPRPATEEVLRDALVTAGERERLMIHLAAFAALRVGEICKVNARDVLGDRGNHVLIVHGKGRRDRLVPISDALAVELRERGHGSHGGWVFPGQVDGHLSAEYVSKLISAALPRGVTAHMLRHRFATVAYQSTGDLRSVQELLGHASIATTQIYTAVTDDAKRAAANAAANLW